MQIQGLSIGYKGSAPVVTAIDAELCLGEFVCLTGRNGTGKSTLLRTLAGLQPPLSGSIDKQDKVSIVLTRSPELQNTTVLEMVCYGRLPYTGWFGRLKEQDREIALQAMGIMGIETLAPRNFATLSDGERQKVMIARAIAQGGDYLLLDEPSAFLDHPSKVELMETLSRLAHEQHLGILLSTHDLELAEKYADRRWTIENSKITVNY